MTITKFDDWIASAKQLIQFSKSAARTSIAATWFSVFDLAGNPGAGTLAGSNTANGVVPTDVTAGCPLINAFGNSATGAISSVDFGNTVAGRLMLADMLFKAGAYSFNSNVSLSSQPSYAARVQLAASWVASTAYKLGDKVVNNSNLYVCVTAGTSAGSGGPSGTGTGITDGGVTWNYVSAGLDYGGTQIWVECVTAFTGNLSVAVTYTNQAGTTGRTTGTVATGVAPTVGRMIQLPLQAGDTGVQKIESVVATVASAGTFNVLVLRPLWSGRSKLANDGDTHAMDKTGLPVIFAASALILAVNADSTSTGIPELQIEIASA